MALIIWIILIFIIAACAVPGFIPFLLTLLGILVGVYAVAAIVANIKNK